MKNITLLIVLIFYFFSSFGQADQNRFVKMPLSGSTQNKVSIRDANLTAVYNLRMPSFSTFNLFNAKTDSSGYIAYQNILKRAALWNGSSWDTIVVRQDLSNYMVIQDGLKRLDSIKVSGLVVTAYAPIKWRINGVNYQKNTNSDFTIPSATNGYNRIDLLYATASNTILRLQGNQTTGVAVEPTPPINTIKVSAIFITGSVISQPFPNLNDYVTMAYADSHYSTISPSGSYIQASPLMTQNAFINISGGIQASSFNILNAPYYVKLSDSYLPPTTVQDRLAIRGGLILTRNDTLISQTLILNPSAPQNPLESFITLPPLSGTLARVEDITAALGVTINSAANPLALADRGYYNYTGSTNATWNLPASPPVGRFYRIYNMGTSGAVLTVNGSGNTLYQGGTSSTSTTLNVGENLTLQFKGLTWAVYGS